MFFYWSRDDIDTVRGTVERGYNMYRTHDDTGILLTLFSVYLTLFEEKRLAPSRIFKLLWRQNVHHL